MLRIITEFISRLTDVFSYPIDCDSIFLKVVMFKYTH